MTQNGDKPRKAPSVPGTVARPTPRNCPGPGVPHSSIYQDSRESRRAKTGHFRG